MGLLIAIGAWIISNIPIVASIVSTAIDVVNNGKKFVKSLNSGRSIFKEELGQDRNKLKIKRPDIDDLKNVSKISDKIDLYRKKLLQVNKQNSNEHKRLQLQIEVMELIISSQTIERFTNNISIHASNLNIHLQTIKNTAGLVEDINRQRYAIKKIMGTINHLINVTDSKGKVNPISGIDVDLRQGNISLYQAYKAFDETKKILEREIHSYNDYLKELYDRIDSIKLAVDESKNPSLERWLNHSVIPSLDLAFKETKSIELAMGSLKELDKPPEEIIELSYEES